MTLLGRLFRLVWGGDVDPALRPVLAVGLVGSIAAATVYRRDRVSLHPARRRLRTRGPAAARLLRRDHSRLAVPGAYMGAFGGTWSVGWAATPFLGLQARHAYGDATMWVCVATVSVVAGILGAAAAGGRDADVAIASPA